MRKNQSKYKRRHFPSRGTLIKLLNFSLFDTKNSFHFLSLLIVHCFLRQFLSLSTLFFLLLLLINFLC